MAPTSSPLVGCAAMRSSGFRPELARHDDLLLVSAREVRGVDRLARRPDVEGGDALPRDVAHGLAVENPVLGQRWLPVIAERDVLDEVEFEDEPTALPIGRDVGHARVDGVGRIGVRDVLALERHGARRRAPQPHDGLDDLALPVAVDSGDTDDLALVHVERHAAHGLELPIVEHLQVLDAQHDIARRGWLLVDPEHDLAADHHLGEPGLVGLARRGLPHEPTGAHDDDTVRERHDLVELVGDDHDRESRVDELADDLEELVDLLRGEHRRWLVENEHARLAEQRLEDLDALLHANREILDERVWIDLEPVALGYRRRPRRARRPCR